MNLNTNSYHFVVSPTHIHRNGEIFTFVADLGQIALNHGVPDAIHIPDTLVQHDLRQAYRRLFAPAEYRFIDKVHALQSQVNDSERFQLVGVLTEEEEHLELSSCFIYFIDDPVAEELIQGAALRSGGAIHVLTEGGFIERIADDGEHFINGRDHGRRQRVVRIGWPVGNNSSIYSTEMEKIASTAIIWARYPFVA